MVIEVPRPHKTAQGTFWLIFLCYQCGYSVLPKKGPISNIPSMMFIKAKGPIYVFV